MQKKANPAALLPILEFLLLYLGLGLIFEYVLKIPMGFYSIPIVVIFLVALLAACCQNRALSFDDKLTLMGQGIGDKNIVTMLLIFLAAGIFVGVVGPLERGERGVFHALDHPVQVCRGGAVRRQLLRLHRHGHERRHHYAHHAHRHPHCRGKRLFPAAVHRLGHGRSDVRRQSELHFRHHHRRLQRARLRDEG